MPLDAKVLTLEEFFKKYRKLIVPNYQRSYKWEQEYVEDLFTDILEGLKLHESKNNRTCFLGSIVLSYDNETETTDLVDGQQRLTTLSILISCISKKLDKGNKLKETIKNLLTTDGTNSVIVHKLNKIVACDDRTAFREIVLNDKPSQNPLGGNKQANAKWRKEFETHLIVQAYQVLEEKISQLIDPKDGSKPIKPEDLLKRIIEGIKLVIIDTDERKEGMRVFASINASGTKLENWELVMSCFYSHGTSEVATKRTESFFEGDRHSLATAFSSTDAAEADVEKNDFLRSHWISINGNIQKDDLFDCYNDLLSKDSANHEKCILSLEKSLRVYKSFKDYKYSHPTAGVIDFSFLHTLNSLKAKLCRPALIAVASLFDDPDELTEAMKRTSFVFEQLHMRWKICGIGANTIDKPLAEIAKLISKGSFGKTPIEIEKNLREKLKELKQSPSREDLVDSFMLRDMTREVPLSKAIASRIQHALKYHGKANRALDFQHVPMVSGGYTLEKGIKLMINEYDKSVRYGCGFRDDDQFRELIYCLGNTFLASSGRIQTNMEFNNCQISSLNAKVIKTRCEELAEVAADIWHF
jgi:hypothetical protein